MRYEFANKPVLTIDLSFLRSLGAGEVLPRAYQYVLPDVAVREIMTGNPDKRAGQAIKLHRFVNAHVDCLFVGAYWQDVSRCEHHPGIGSNRETAIAWDTTKLVREAEPQSEADMLQTDMSHEIQEHLDDQADFLRNIKLRTAQLESNEHYSKKCIDGMRNNPSEQAGYIRQPECVARWIDGLPTERHKTVEWREALTVFPDEHAIGRWIRLMDWYAMKHVIRASRRKFENNWEDAQYAFTASYFDGLLTRDSGLAETMAAIFPNVRVLKHTGDFAQSEHRYGATG